MVWDGRRNDATTRVFVVYVPLGLAKSSDEREKERVDARKAVRGPKADTADEDAARRTPNMVAFMVSGNDTGWFGSLARRRMMSPKIFFVDGREPMAERFWICAPFHHVTMMGGVNRNYPSYDFNRGRQYRP